MGFDFRLLEKMFSGELFSQTSKLLISGLWKVKGQFCKSLL